LVLERRYVVIDASLAINSVMPPHPYHVHTVALLRNLAFDQTFLAAPPLFESEADSAIRRYVYHGLLDRDAGKAAQELLIALPVAIIQHDSVRQRARDIAESFGQDRVYDATYSALAEILGCDFWTADQAFYLSVKERLSYVRFIGEFTP
jgi:predicted nucleic acid-binding protein